jgi:hypothetical protein
VLGWVFGPIGQIMYRSKHLLPIIGLLYNHRGDRNLVTLQGLSIMLQ